MLDAKQLVHELQSLRDQGHLSDALLRYAVRNVSKSDPRFDWVGVYLMDNDKNEWIYVPKGTCTRITGGTVAAVKPAK